MDALNKVGGSRARPSFPQRRLIGAWLGLLATKPPGQAGVYCWPSEESHAACGAVDQAAAVET